MAAVKDVPQRPYACLISQYQVDSDWAYQHLKCVELKEKKMKKYRIFDEEVLPAGAKITGYEWFDTHPELVMFEGWEDNEGRTELLKKGEQR